MKTSELTGAALDWAVAEVNGTPIYRSGKTLSRMDVDGGIYWQPSIDWSQAGPIIERESIFVLREQSGFKGRRLWAATSGASKAIGLNDDSVKLYRDAFYFGPTPLVAAMRCYVASKLGDDVDVPEELK